MNIDEIEGKAIVVEGNDIDTDQIIPARYMKEVTFEGIERYAFYDLRYDAEGKEKEHPFNDKKYAGASMLVVNENFGCGSSREHAPQTLQRSGIRAIIGESFAEIFAGNCTALGVPTVCLKKSDIREIQREIVSGADKTLRVKLGENAVYYGTKKYESFVPPQIRKALRDGTWDSTHVMMYNEKEIQRVYDTLPYIKGTYRDI